ncbi:MAG: hypothetical protein DMF14_05770 [Verrucomicrobia bacterium]|nr:MAG: hypothetical protein DMF14_05770 [Verrucomicrobiota bacterium]
MTAIVDKKALRTLLSLKAIARSRCQVQTAPRFDELLPDAAASSKRRRTGAFQDASRIPVPVQLCASFGVRSRNCRTASDSCR